MSDLKNFVKAKVSDYSEKNMALAKEKCLEAEQCLKQAHENNSDRKLVVKAIELYMQAASYYTKFAEPYIGIAYISFSAGKFDEAASLLNKALEFEPLNEKAKNLLKMVKAEKTSSVKNGKAEKNISSEMKKIKNKKVAAGSKKQTVPEQENTETGEDIDIQGYIYNLEFIDREKN